MSDAHHVLRRALMELAALLSELRALAGQGNRERYLSDAHYRWVIHRWWIAVGNEVQYLRPESRQLRPWRDLRLMRNQLAHVRLPDIEDDLVWRVTVMRPAELMDRLAQIPG
jgi:uncharacterized protein with HEPN domain